MNAQQMVGYWAEKYAGSRGPHVHVHRSWKMAGYLDEKFYGTFIGCCVEYKSMELTLEFFKMQDKQWIEYCTQCQLLHKERI